MIENVDALIKDCQNNSIKAQEALYHGYSRLVMGIAVRYAKSRYDAEDVFQEIFIKIFQNISQYRNDGSFEGWIRRISVNTSLKRIQKEKFQQLLDDIGEIKEEPVPHEGALDKIAAKELVELIDKLPLGYKTIFNLYAVEGYSHKEIAESLRISEGTSKSQYFHAKKMLKQLLQQNNISAHAI